MIPESIFYTLRSLRMSDLEKQQRKAVILQTMLATPAVHTPPLYRHLTTGFFVAVVLLIGGVSLIAEGSLPGDLTYPIKIQVTERVLDAVEVSSEDQMSWDVSKAERRQEEIEMLATEAGF